MTINEYAKIFKILSEPIRIQIIMIIFREKNVNADKILKKLNITQPTLSFHLKKLVSTKLIKFKKVKQSCIYTLNWELFAKALTGVNETPLLSKLKK